MATPSPMNRGYASGLAANRAPTTGLAANRAPTTGLAAGAQPGGSFRPNLAPMNYGMARPAAAQSPQPAPMAPAAPMPGTTQPPMATPAPMDFSLPEPPPVDFSNMFGAQPLPAPGQQSFNQPPPNPFGPAPLPFGGFRAEGGPVQPGQAYMVGERGPEMIVPQMPGMVLPNQSLTGRASASDGAVRSGPLSTRGATPVGSGRGMTPERRLEIAARRGDQRANLALFNAEQWGRGGRGPARALPPPMPMGRAPQAMTRPMPDFPPRSPAQQPQAPEPMAAPQFDLSNMLPPMAPAGPMAPLPPSTLMGGTGVPPPPQFQVQNVGGYEVLTNNGQYVNARGAAAAPAPGMTTAGYRMLDDYNRQNPGKPLVFTGQFEPNGNPVLAPAPAAQSKEDYQIGSVPGPMIKDPVTGKEVPGPPMPVRIDKKTGKYTRLTEEQAAEQAAEQAGAAAAPDKPSWSSWLDEQTQPQ